MIACFFMSMNKGPLSQMSRLLALLAALTLLAGAAGCRERSPDAASAPVLLQINGLSITLDEFNRRFEQTLPLDNTLGQDEKDELKRAFLRQVIDRELTLAEARRLELTVSPEEVEAALAEYRRDYPDDEFDKLLQAQGISLAQWRAELAERLLMEKVLNQAVYASIEISEEQISAYYQAHRDEFDRPAQVRARQIVLDSEDQGREVLAQLRKGASFAEMAELFSLSPDAENGGDLGYFPRGEMPPEFDAVVFNLPVGELSDLVKSDYGFHIFLVEDRREARSLSQAEAAAEIEALLRRAEEERAYQDWLMELGAKARIDVNWQLL